MDVETVADSYVMLGQVARTTRRFDELRAWYRDTLGLPELYAFGNLAFFDLGGVRLMLGEEGTARRSRPLCATPTSTRQRRRWRHEA